MLTIKNLKAKVITDEGGKEILKGLDLEVNAGEVHAIMGPNGSGPKLGIPDNHRIILVALLLRKGNLLQAGGILITDMQLATTGMSF